MLHRVRQGIGKDAAAILSAPPFDLDRCGAMEEIRLQVGEPRVRPMGACLGSTMSPAFVNPLFIVHLSLEGTGRKHPSQGAWFEFRLRGGPDLQPLNSRRRVSALSSPRAEIGSSVLKAIISLQKKDGSRRYVTNARGFPRGVRGFRYA